MQLKGSSGRWQQRPTLLVGCCCPVLSAFGSHRYVGVKENALAFHAFRKICSAVKKAALFEQSIVGNLSDQYTVMNTTKATPDHHKCEFAAFRLSKFFSPSAAGVWAPHQKGVGRRSPRAFGPPDALLVGCKRNSPQGETLHPLACWRKHQLVC